MLLLIVLKVVVALGATFYVLKQVRKPDRWLGRLFTSVMNHSHSHLTDWGLAHVRIEHDASILDIGCGGGRTIEKLAALAIDGKVCGIDYAPGSVAASRAKNSDLVRTGRVKIERASVSHMPFGADEFDLVTAIETQYYWPDLVNDMRETVRVLKPGGVLLVIAETYKGASNEFIQGWIMRLLGSSSLSVQDQRELFARAGYGDVEVFEERAKGWICVKGEKP
jgi:ubiquinone/menaquinone biosynthesis C-methylase UbiE